MNHINFLFSESISSLNTENRYKVISDFFVYVDKFPIEIDIKFDEFHKDRFSNLIERKISSKHELQKFILLLSIFPHDDECDSSLTNFLIQSFNIEEEFDEYIKNSSHLDFYDYCFSERSLKSIKLDESQYPVWSYVNGDCESDFNYEVKISIQNYDNLIRLFGYQYPTNHHEHQFNIFIIKLFKLVEDKLIDLNQFFIFINYLKSTYRSYINQFINSCSNDEQVSFSKYCFDTKSTSFISILR